MKKILITEACSIKGEHVPAGETRTLDIVTAEDIVSSGRGKEIKPGKVVNQNADLENRDPEAENRDPAPARKKGKQAPPAADEAPAESTD